jgi:multiple antibiotic resistance protein
VTIYLVMRFSTVLARILKPTGILVLTRIAGLLLAAIAVQLIADGVFGFIAANGT